MFNVSVNILNVTEIASTLDIISVYIKNKLYELPISINQNS